MESYDPAYIAADVLSERPTESQAAPDPDSKTTGPAAFPPPYWARVLDRIYWPRILSEGIAIVVSILLAFALNAWWEEAKAHRSEEEILEGLRFDFEGNLAGWGPLDDPERPRLAVVTIVG